MTTDTITAAWTRNRSDDLAVTAGCSFDVRRAAYTVWWIERFCKLYEGEWAGSPLRLHDCHECEPWPVAGEWFDARGNENETTIADCLARAERYIACVAAGHEVDWQYECVMRLYGWVKWSDRWKRNIRRFRKASIFLAKKNKKSPTLAANALYMTCGDGEPGQKVFLAAKDGQQAKDNAGRHAIEMLNLSPELMKACTVNKVEARITHEASRSFLKPMSSANAPSQKAAEGLNGSAFVDETHVVDREFMGRISRMGISRSEPLIAEFSTAGDDPDGYGKEQFDYAQKVIAGEVEDQQFFGLVYAAPQDVTDEELLADPLKFARMANPAMGHTVDPEELLEDVRTSHAKSPREFARCKMYRFNIWQHAHNAWLGQTDWAACGEAYTLEDLLGRTCWAGLDLSKTRDTTALVLAFEPVLPAEHIKLWPLFWLPEARATALSDKVPFEQWGRDGHVELTPGNWIDYRAVRDRLNWIRDNFDLKCLLYDPKFASELVHGLRADDEWDEDQVQEFGQSNLNFASPTTEFERAVMAHELTHPNNPVLNWQASHVAVDEHKTTRIKRAVKPGTHTGDPRTIDGIVASIMAMAGAMANIGNENEAWYTPGILRN